MTQIIVPKGVWEIVLGYHKTVPSDFMVVCNEFGTAIMINVKYICSIEGPFLSRSKHPKSYFVVDRNDPDNFMRRKNVIVYKHLNPTLFKEFLKKINPINAI